jgi:hypothetical protein
MADISYKSWNSYIKRLRSLSDKAASELIRFIADGHDVYSDPSMSKEVIDYAYALTTKYGEGAGALASEMYDALAELSGKAVPAAVPAETATYGEVAKAVYGTKLQSDKPEVMAGAVGRMVKMAGVDTMQQNALRDGAEWAWIPRGDTCAFCLTLASRGWQKASRKAIKNGHAEHVHANCDCTYAIRFSDDVNVEGYDPEALKAMYDEAEGATPNDKINYLRRRFYAENKGLVGAESSKAEEFIPNISTQKKLAEVYERRRLKDGLKMTPYEELEGLKLNNPVTVDFGNLSDETQNAFARTIANLSSDYNTMLMSVRTMDKAEALGNTAFATTRNYYSLGSGELLINPLKCKDYDKMVDRLRELKESRYIPRLKAGAEGDYLMTHEFAHSLLQMESPLKESTNFVGMDYGSIKKARKEIEGVYKRYLDEVKELESVYKKAELDAMLGDSMDAFKKAKGLKDKLEAVRISRYSLTNPDEFMAEAFADSILGESPSKYSGEVAEIINKYFRR